MAQLRGNRSRNLKITGGVVAVAAAFLVLKTFPHLKETFTGYITGRKDLPNEDNEPIELNESEKENEETEKEANSSYLEDQSLVNVSEWPEDSLKSWLAEKEINPPQNASHHDLVSLVKSIQEDTH